MNTISANKRDIKVLYQVKVLLMNYRSPLYPKYAFQEKQSNLINANL